jgi:hypothetical protein
MTTHRASIFVELEIRVSGTLVPSEPPTHDPPYPGSDGGWEDVMVEEIAIGGGFSSPRRELLPTQSYPPSLALFLDNLTDAVRDEIQDALSAEVPDGPDPDDARDRQIDARVMDGEK